MEKYMRFEYKAGARGENGLIDCWGLVRMVRTELFGLPELPEFAEARFGDAVSIQSAYETQAPRMQEVEPRAGAIAALIRRGLCLHVAVMVDDNTVLDIRRDGTRARLYSRSDWVRDFPAPMWQIRYYCDQTDKPQAIK